MSEESVNGISIGEANARIAKLSKLPVPTCSETEDWSVPLDADIKVSGSYPYHNISLEADGQSVSWCTVIDFQQQIGTQQLRMGGIGGVGTHDNYRFRGLSKRVLTNALSWMRREGFDTSMLYGITGFYPRFGYAEAFPGIIHTMALRDAERAVGGDYQLAELTPEHIPAVLALYAKNNAGRTGVTWRDPQQWTTFRKGLNWWSKASANVLLDACGAVAGYFVSDAGEVQEIIEVGYAAHAVFSDILRAIAAQVWDARIETIRFNLPDDHAFIHYCRPFGMHAQHIYRRDGGAMVRMMNITTALSKLTPLLAARMPGRGALTVRTNLDSVGLSWADGELYVTEPQANSEWVQLPQWCLAQMLYGYLDAESPACDNAITASGNGRAILAQLFPAMAHYHYAVDYF